MQYSHSMFWFLTACHIILPPSGIILVEKARWLYVKSNVIMNKQNAKCCIYFNNSYQSILSQISASRTLKRWNCNTTSLCATAYIDYGLHCALFCWIVRNIRPTPANKKYWLGKVLAYKNAGSLTEKQVAGDVFVWSSWEPRLLNIQEQNKFFSIHRFMSQPRPIQWYH
jgi:hypothetical protein